MVKLIGEPLFQWDTGRKVSVTPAYGVEIQEVHFANKGDSRAIPVAVANGTADIPDVLLQTGRTVAVYGVEIQDGRERSVDELFLPVRERPKPGDYVYTEPEILSWKSLDERLKKLEESGDGGSIELDATLTQEGMAADAKAVGDRIGDIIKDGKTALDSTWSSKKIEASLSSGFDNVENTCMSYTASVEAHVRGQDESIYNLERSVGDIDSALDGIIAIQNELIGGEEQ